MILCDSDLRLAWGGGVADAVRLAADAGYEGIAAGRRCGLGALGALVAQAAGAGLGVPVVGAPLAPAPPAPGRRLPYLAAADPDERAAAAVLCEDTWQEAVVLGARATALDCGVVALGVNAAAVARAFARRELGVDADDDGEDDDDGGGPGGALLERALAERRARSAEVLDACRYSLDRLLRAAERHGLVVALEVAADPWGAPSPREAAALLAAYRGSSLGVVWDPARLDVLRALGTAPAPARLEALAAAARIVRANEAVGIEPGYLPGLGDRAGSGDDVAPPLPTGIDTIVTGRPDSTAAEVARARVAAG